MFILTVRQGSIPILSNLDHTFQIEMNTAILKVYFEGEFFTFSFTPMIDQSQTSIFTRVRTGHGKPGKSWKIKIPKSKPGKRGKLVSVMES